MIVKKTVFDLKTFGDVTIGLDFTPTPAFSTIADAMAFFGNDETKVLAALNEVKVSAEVAKAKNTPIAEWHTFEDDEETILNGPAEIESVNEKLVNDLVLNIAKQHFGFAKNLSVEAKRKAKEDALKFVQGQPALKAYLTVMSNAPVPAATNGASV